MTSGKHNSVIYLALEVLSQGVAVNGFRRRQRLISRSRSQRRDASYRQHLKSPVLGSFCPGLRLQAPLLLGACKTTNMRHMNRYTEQDIVYLIQNYKLHTFIIFVMVLRLHNLIKY